MTQPKIVTDFLRENFGKTIDSNMVVALTLLVKTQDRDTRHACAEAILECDPNHIGVQYYINDCHAACVNCQNSIK